MNILVIHETDYIDKVVFEYQIIPEILASKGHNVYVMECPMNWKKDYWLDFGSMKTNYFYNFKKTDKKSGITLIRPGFIKIPILSRISAFISFFFVIPQVIKKHKIDKIILYAIPTNGLQTIFWAKIFKIPVHFRSLDILHRLVPYKILSPLTYFLEKWVYSRVNQISAITPKLVSYIKQMGNVKNIILLPTGFDADFFYPKEKDKALMKKYDLNPKDKIIIFSGTLFNFSGLDKLLEYFGQNLKDYKNLKFLIIGRGEQLEKLKKIVRVGHLEKNVTFTGFIEYKNLVNYISLADICINPFQLNYITDRIFPSKIYQYLACQKPVIATRLPGMLDIFPNNNGQNNIYYFNSNNTQEFFKLIPTITWSNSTSVLSLQEITDKIELLLRELKIITL